VPPEVLDLFTELASVPSPPGRERGVADLVVRYLRDCGLETDEDDAGPGIDSTMGNFLSRSEPTAEGDLLDVAGISPDETVSQGEDPYAAAADSWAAGQPISLSEDDDESAARRLYDLALEYQERSQRSEARLLDEFEGASSGLVSVIGDLIIVDDDDERLSLTTSGFRAEVVPEDADDEWRTLTGSDELVEFYDPTDVFGDLADALAEAFPAVAPELAGASSDGTGEGEGDGEGGDGGAVATAEADGDAEDEPTA